jgi:glycoside/pentoside/hexuronide:cation symporter, GPH family
MNDNKIIFSYSLLALPIAFIGLPIYLYLPNYYHQNFGLDYQFIGVSLLSIKLIDAFLSPVIGYYSDRYFKYRKRLIFCAAIMMAISFFLLFSPITERFISLWLVVALFLTYSFYSILNINYQAIAVSISQNSNKNTKFVATREFFAAMGIIVAIIIPEIFKYYFQFSNPFSYSAMFLLALTIILINIFYHNIEIDYQVKKLRFNFQHLFKIPELKDFLIIFSLISFSQAIPAVLILFFITDIVGEVRYSALYLLIFFLGMMLGMILWSKISALINNKRRIWFYAILGSILIFLSCYFVGHGDRYFYVVICLLLGLFLAADYCLSFSILADIIQEYGIDKEVSIFGVVNFIFKIAFVVSAGLILIIIGKVTTDYSQYYQLLLRNIYIISPFILKAIAALFLYKGSRS